MEPDLPPNAVPVEPATSTAPITKGQFRWLLTASIIATVLGIVISFAAESRLPQPLRDYLATETDALTITDMILVVIFIPLVVATILSVIGLYRFWNVARPLTLITWIVGLIIQPLLGPTVDHGLATSLYELAALLNGIIIAIIYLTPAKSMV
jgi:hypothetical protein